MGYDERSQYYGVYIWEQLNVLNRLLYDEPRMLTVDELTFHCPKSPFPEWAGKILEDGGFTLPES